MSMGMHTDTAQILAFPKRTRSESSVFGKQNTNVVNLSLHRLPMASIGDGWYHDEAISEQRDNQS
ncbi:MAG: DUF2735 domain-containing protein [Rhizobiaceae bacterium]|nr:DUF2735 domain-containing protein [Rhizobiaceae bacterium]